MRTVSLALHALRRDWRAGELRLLAAAVVVAVAAVTTAAGFTDRVARALELQATELLAADLVLESPEPIGTGVAEAAAAAGLAAARSISFRSMATAGERLELSEVKAVGSGYPLRGAMRTGAELFGPETEVRAIPAPGTVWPDTRLMQALGLRVGDRISLGSAQLTVARILTYEPDRGGDLFNIAPRILMNLDDVPRTGLLLPGSRAQYRLLLRGDPSSIEAFRKRVDSGRGDALRVYGVGDARPELRVALERARQFLGLAVLVSVALCGMAIAMSARHFAERHYDTCAILRCLGATERDIGRLYLCELALLALLFGIAGCALGAICQEGLAALLRGLTVRPLPAPTALPVAIGLLAGISSVLGFALPWLWRLRSTPPLRVFRRDLAPIPPRGVSVLIAALLALALLVPWQAGEIRLTAFVATGLAAAAGCLALCAWLAIRLARGLRSHVGLSWRFGIANVARRARDSTAQIIAIGLGVTVMLLLTLARTDVLNAWRDNLAPGTPNYFVINIQPDQVQALRDFIRRGTGVETELHPMVRGRLVRINGRPVGPDDFPDPRAQRLVTREFNLSWTARLQSDNALVAGRWWTDAAARQPAFSVEQDIATSLGVGLGDRLTYLVAGREISGDVRSLRRVEWDSFRVNFFVLASPGALDGLPATFITSFYLPGERRPLLSSLVREFPSVTVIDVAALMDQVRAIIVQIARTVEFIAAFTLAAGCIVLLAAIRTTQDERLNETAILRSLGATRRRVVAAHTAEFAVLGAIAGVLAAASATAIELVLARFVFRVETGINPWIWLAGPAACLAVTLAGSYIGTRRALAAPPIEVLQRV